MPAERILQVADEMFRKYGVRSVTMDDLAKELSVSKKTLYQHFKDKDELVFKITEMNIRRIDSDMQDIRKKSTDAIDEVIQIMNYMGVFFSNMQLTLMYDIKKYFPKAWKFYTDFKMQTLSNDLMLNIKRGIKEGLYRKNLNADIIVKMRLEQIEDCFKPEVFPPHQYKLAEVEIQVLMHFLYGLVSAKGYKTIEDYTKHKPLNKNIQLI